MHAILGKSGWLAGAIGGNYPDWAVTVTVLHFRTHGSRREFVQAVKIVLGYGKELFNGQDAESRTTCIGNCVIIPKYSGFLTRSFCEA